MKFSGIFIRRASALALTSAVVGCGGGGGGNTPTTVAAPRLYTSTEAKLVAGGGLVTVEALSGHMQLEQAFFANFIQGYSAAGNTASGSSPTITISCASGGSGAGSFSSSVSKSGVYTGLKSNDTFNMSFNGCSLPGTGLTLNGQAVIQATADNLNLGSNFLAQYRLTTANFDMSIGSSKFRSSGAQNIRYDATAAGPSFSDLSSTVVGSYVYGIFNQASATTASVNVTLTTGAVLNTKTTTSNTFVTSFNGSLQSSTSAGAFTSTISTAAPLSGPSNSTTGRPIPTSGILNATDTTLNLATSTTIQPVAVFVKFDSNGDGSLESTYTTTYTALTTF